MKSKYDIIVIGGGHNGLACANYLANKSKNVLLIEKNEYLGGLASSTEFHPAYKTAGILHDTSNIRKHLVEELGLRKHGLEIEDNRAEIFLIKENGPTLKLSSDIKDTCDEISKFSKNDAKAYLRYRAFIDKISKFFIPLLSEMPPDLINLGGKQLLNLAKKAIGLRKLGKTTMMELLKVAPMSVMDFLDEYFENEDLKAGLAAPAVFGSFNGPRASYTTLNLLIWECMAIYHIKGGPKALIEALEKSCVSNGVDILKNQCVMKINVVHGENVNGVTLEDGTTFEGNIVAASCHPKETFLKLIPASVLDLRTEQSFIHYRSRGTTAKMDLALNCQARFRSDPEKKISFARITGDFTSMEKAFDSVKYGSYSDSPILDIHIPSNGDSSLAPVGNSVVSVLTHFVPYDLKDGWNEKQNKIIQEKLISYLQRYMIFDASNIIGTQFLSPKDFENVYHIHGGNIFHGEHAIDQLTTRPTPYCARYDTPIKGLFLCGSGSHPGGGITCGPGILAAIRILSA